MSDKKNKKTSYIGFKCQKWVKDELETRAKKEKRSLSNYIYSLLVNNIRDHNDTNED
jgi:hypothetical protein